MRIVFIHGRSQGGKNAEELRLFWGGCLERSCRAIGLRLPEDAEVVLPFYADDLDRMVREVNAPLVSNILLRGDTAVSSKEEARVEMLREILEAQGIPDDQVIAQFDGQPIERGLQNWRFVLAMLRVLDRTPLGSEAIDAITRDVWVYVTFGGVRAKIDAIVDAAIPDERCVVVAHSLGTIVAYNVLSQRKAKGLQVPLLVTLGSPLGMRTITARLNKPLATPPRVQAWFNARDRRDVVALYPLDASHFDVQPAIQNHSGVDNFTDNRHSIDGYLADAEVARRIHGALGA